MWKYKVSSKEIFQWFHLGKVPKAYFSMSAEMIELTDDDLDISLSDMKHVLRKIKSCDYTLDYLHDWIELFLFTLSQYLTVSRRESKINQYFEPWEVGFEDDELNYILHELWGIIVSAENISNEFIADIDDLIQDIEYFEEESELGNVLRRNFSELRKGNIILKFANMENEELFSEDLIALYKQMMLVVLAVSEGIYKCQNQLEGFCNSIIISPISSNEKGQKGGLKYKLLLT